MPWATSDRRSRLPKDWAKRRRETQIRANNRCQATTHAADCNGLGSECDHIIPNDDHSPENRQWLSHACHLAKTLREAQAARPTRKRPPERHPGAL